MRCKKYAIINVINGIVWYDKHWFCILRICSFQNCYYPFSYYFFWFSFEYCHKALSKILMLPCIFSMILGITQYISTTFCVILHCLFMISTISFCSLYSPYSHVQWISISYVPTLVCQVTLLSGKGHQNLLSIISKKTKNSQIQARFSLKRWCWLNVWGLRDTWKHVW